jgi:predicted transcriptional regulator
MERASLGELELSLLQFIADHAPITVGEAAEQYGQPHGLARTTILTVMDRLRKKGYLARTQIDGVYRYVPCMQKGDLLRSLVDDFTQRVLGGSLHPFMAYLAEDAQVTDDELEELRALLQRLEEKRAED